MKYAIIYIYIFLPIQIVNADQTRAVQNHKTLLKFALNPHELFQLKYMTFPISLDHVFLFYEIHVLG